MNLEQLTDLSQHANAVELARHSVQAKLAYTIRTFSPLLKGILEINIHDALMGTQQDSPLSGGG